MSITSAALPRQRGQTVSRSNVRLKSSSVLIAAIATTVLAYLPVLLIYLPQLWARQYYRFFPFAFLATFGLAIARSGDWLGTSGSKYRWASRVGMFVCAEGLLGLGLWFQSPWPCFVAFVMTIGIVLDFWEDKAGHRTLLYLILPLLLVIRPPLHLDETVVQGLQSTTSQFASLFLSGMGIDHLLSGNVIEPLTGSALLVEEACSGVQSLFTMMFIAAFLSVYCRYTLARALILTGSAVLWALMMNIFRVIAIVVAQTEFQADLSTGWQHELVGYMGMLFAVVMLLSTDRLLQFLLGGISDEPLRHPSINLFVSSWNRLMVSPDLLIRETATAGAGPAAKDNRTNKPGSPPSEPFSRRTIIALVSLVVVALISATPAWSLPGLRPASATRKEIRQLQAVNASWLPENSFSGCHLLTFDVQKRTAESQFGQYSDEWMFAAPFGNVLHSMDHVFDSWHNLTVCYRGVGWRLERLVEKTPPDAGGPWPIVYAEFVKPTGERAHLCFSLFTITGEPVLPEGETGGLAGIRRRLAQSNLDGRPVIQVQSLNESIIGLTPTGIEQLVRVHAQARERLRDRVLQETGNGGTADSTSGSSADQSGGER
jgi:exosortase